MTRPYSGLFRRYAPRNDALRPAFCRHCELRSSEATRHCEGESRSNPLIFHHYRVGDVSAGALFAMTCKIPF
ncbi:MAG: hypothetical protein LBP85_01035 [Prevotellaceae bacterium]|nr:hypothetical protein [Prevotellaceae bacterium]